jgi:hypothetical protein
MLFGQQSCAHKFLIEVVRLGGVTRAPIDGDYFEDFKAH